MIYQNLYGTLWFVTCSEILKYSEVNNAIQPKNHAYKKIQYSAQPCLQPTPQSKVQ